MFCFPLPLFLLPRGDFCSFFSSKLDSSCEEIKFLLPPPFSSFPFHSQLLFLRRHRHVPYVSPPTPHFGFIPLLSRMMRDGSRGDRSRKKSKGIGEKKSSPAEWCTEFNPPLPVRPPSSRSKCIFLSVFTRDVTPSRSGNTQKKKSPFFPVLLFGGLGQQGPPGRAHLSRANERGICLSGEDATHFREVGRRDVSASKINKSLLNSKPAAAVVSVRPPPKPHSLATVERRRGMIVK